MKTSLILFTLLLALAVPPLAGAAERKAAAGRDALTARFATGLEELNLSEEQKGRIQDYLRENGESLRALREDQNTPREEKMKKFQEFQEKFAARMKEVLSKEQFEKWEKSRAAGPGGAAGGLAGARERMQKVMEELNLTDEQKEKVRAALQEQGQSLQGLRDAAPEERREKFQKMQETMGAKMKEILTKEQFEKWEKSRPEIGGRLGGGDAPRKKRDENK